MRLQDEFGLDVNLLLFACWRGVSGGRELLQADWCRLIDGTKDWRRDVVEPLRAVRRFLKEQGASPQSSALRDRVLALELDAEHAEQLTIVELAGAQDGGGTGKADLLAALEGYVDAAGVCLTDSGRAGLAFLAREATTFGKM